MVFGEDGNAKSQLTIREVIDTKMRKKSGSGSASAKKSQAEVAYKVLLGLVKRDLKLMNYFMK